MMSGSWIRSHPLHEHTAKKKKKKKHSHTPSEKTKTSTTQQHKASEPQLKSKRPHMRCSTTEDLIKKQKSGF
jgi:hypothetical protein